VVRNTIVSPQLFQTLSAPNPPLQRPHSCLTTQHPPIRLCPPTPPCASGLSHRKPPTPLCSRSQVTASKLLGSLEPPVQTMASRLLGSPLAHAPGKVRLPYAEELWAPQPSLELCWVLMGCGARTLPGKGTGGSAIPLMSLLAHFLASGCRSGQLL
jgi:hypothetical protein